MTPCWQQELPGIRQWHQSWHNTASCAKILWLSRRDLTMDRNISKYKPLGIGNLRARKLSETFTKKKRNPPSTKMYLKTKTLKVGKVAVIGTRKFRTTFLSANDVVDEESSSSSSSCAPPPWTPLRCRQSLSQSDVLAPPWTASTQADVVAPNRSANKLDRFRTAARI